jgi:hypothetical protein
MKFIREGDGFVFCLFFSFFCEPAKKLSGNNSSFYGSVFRIPSARKGLPPVCSSFHGCTGKERVGLPERQADKKIGEETSPSPIFAFRSFADSVFKQTGSLKNEPAHGK